MNPALSQRQAKSLLDDANTCQKLTLNFRRNEAQDQSANIDAAAEAFEYEACRDAWWNPEEYSLLYGTPLWDQASASQRLILNHLYWVAYYSQIISAEIATILLNQTSAAGLNTLEDFRLVCDTLDLESAQERAHVAAFKKIGEAIELSLVGERLFTWPLRSIFDATMVFDANNSIERFWRNIQVRAFSMLSAGNAFIGCQYFTVRGLRTLNGKMIQHGLAKPALSAAERETAPIPTLVSYYHFMDESFHFNSSRILSHDVIRSLPEPTRFEKWVANRAIAGCQRDHYHFSATIKGIFWYEPALFETIYKLFRTPIFGMSDADARQMMHRCFAEESEGLHQSAAIHRTATESYRAYLEPLGYVDRANKEMATMGRSSIARYLATNRRALARFQAGS